MMGGTSVVALYGTSQIAYLLQLLTGLHLDMSMFFFWPSVKNTTTIRNRSESRSSQRAILETRETRTTIMLIFLQLARAFVNGTTLRGATEDQYGRYQQSPTKVLTSHQCQRS